MISQELIIDISPKTKDVPAKEFFRPVDGVVEEFYQQPILFVLNPIPSSGNTRKNDERRMIISEAVRWNQKKLLEKTGFCENGCYVDVLDKVDNEVIKDIGSKIQSNCNTHYDVPDAAVQVAFTISIGRCCLWVDNYFCSLYRPDNLNSLFRRRNCLHFFAHCADKPEPETVQQKIGWLNDPRSLKEKQKNVKRWEEIIKNQDAQGKEIAKTKEEAAKYREKEKYRFDFNITPETPQSVMEMIFGQIEPFEIELKDFTEEGRKERESEMMKVVSRKVEEDLQKMIEEKKKENF